MLNCSNRQNRIETPVRMTERRVRIALARYYVHRKGVELLGRNFYCRGANGGTDRHAIIELRSHANRGMGNRIFVVTIASSECTVNQKSRKLARKPQFHDCEPEVTITELRTRRRPR